MPSYGAAAGYYSTGHWMTTCGDGLASEVLSFGFLAYGLRIDNTCTDPLYFTLTEVAASSGMAFIVGCSSVSLPGPIKTGGIGIMTTSTSTGAGLPTARPRISVTAWGG